MEFWIRSNKDDDDIKDIAMAAGRDRGNIIDNLSLNIRSRKDPSRSRHSGSRFAGYGFALGYHCLFCNAVNIFSDLNEDYIKCFECGKSWTYQEFLNDLDFAIKEGEQQD